VFLVLFGGSRCLVEVVREKPEFDVPLIPFLFGHEQVIANVAEELHLHDVDLLDCDSGDLCPCLVGVCVIVED
jgi:hypothetical protein